MAGIRRQPNVVALWFVSGVVSDRSGHCVAREHVAPAPNNNHPSQPGCSPRKRSALLPLILEESAIPSHKGSAYKSIPKPQFRSKTR
jgi:hypothetical protein